LKPEVMRLDPLRSSMVIRMTDTSTSTATKARVRRVRRGLATLSRPRISEMTR
jgi:hypothetical protein